MQGQGNHIYCQKNKKQSHIRQHWVKEQRVSNPNIKIQDWWRNAFQFPPHCLLFFLVLSFLSTIFLMRSISSSPLALSSCCLLLPLLLASLVSKLVSLIHHQPLLFTLLPAIHNKRYVIKETGSRSHDDPHPLLPQQEPEGTLLSFPPSLRFHSLSVTFFFYILRKDGETITQRRGPKRKIRRKKSVC